MPTIAITMGKTSKANKQQLIQGLTEKAVEITKVPEQFFTVLINELPYEAMGVGGRTVEEIMADRG